MHKYKSQLVSIKKLRLYREIKKLVLAKMRRDVITPDEAKSLMNKIKIDIKSISSVKKLVDYYNTLAKQHPIFVQL